MKQDTLSRKQEIGGLYGYRVIMSLIVANYHIWQQGWLTQGFHLFGKWISYDYITRTGYMMVDGLILLSGFLMFLPHARCMLDGSQPPKTIPFYIKRLARIVPSNLVAVLAAAFIATSPMFKGLIEVLSARFSYSGNLSDFTTNRTDLWRAYFEEFLTNWKTLFLGKGLTNLKIGGRSAHNTIIQMVFQFGLIGTPVLLAWSGYFFADTPRKGGMKGQALNALMLLIGTILPWMALDILFFDEFFLLQMYVFLGLGHLHGGTGEAQELPPAMTQEE